MTTKYIPYKGISKHPDSSTYIPPELYDAQQEAIAKIPSQLRKQWDDWVASQIGMEKEAMWECYSCEQIDSIGIAIYDFENGRDLFIGDETGIGKGRILSGISRYAWNNGKKVLFFTEREHLISEFWKDLYHTNNISVIKNPICYHGSAKVFNLEGKVELKGTPKLIKQIAEHGFPEDTNLVMTNYSQFGLKDHKTSKLPGLLEYCKDTILILDECHNAIGDSNTNKVLKALSDVCCNRIFSSATFLNRADQLSLYQSAIKMDESTFKLLQRGLESDTTDTLRKVFTYELTKNLQFWRREHEPLEDAYHTLFCGNEEYNNEVIQSYSEVINSLFKIVNTISEDPSVETNIATNAWFALGATINRLSRNLLLVLKLDTVIASVQEQIKLNRKAVIVLDSTLASLVKKIDDKDRGLKAQAEDSEIDAIDELEIGTSDSVFNFQRAILYIINEVLGECMKNPYISPDVKALYDKMIEKTNIFKDLSLSPIDTLLQSLGKKGINCGEISGRTFRLNQEGKIEKLVKEPKTKIVGKFNSGETDVVIITRAGASGISLHASAAFKDQKVRVLYELEITNRPTYRLQFMGRVNRKNQVEKPLFFLVVTKLPFEQRILNVEQRKLQKLQSHISGDKGKMDQASVFNFYNPHTEKAAHSYLMNNKHVAFQMGISLQGDSKEEYFFVDSLLKRCIVLPVAAQNLLYDYLIHTVEAYKKLEIRKNLPDLTEMVSIKNFWHQMPDEEIPQFQAEYKNFPHLCINQFKYSWVGLMKIKAVYKTAHIFSQFLKDDLEKNYSKQTQVTAFASKCGHQINASNFYSRDYMNKSVLPRLRNLKIGTNVSIKNPEGIIYGYINDVVMPNLGDAHKYPDLTLIHIKTVNPHLHNSLYYAKEDYYMTLVEYIESDNIEFSNNPIDWKKYSRPENDFERFNYAFVGNPVYMQFLQQSYGVGDIEYMEVGSRKYMCVLLPHTFSEETIMKMKRPVFEAKKVIGGLMSKSIGALTTVWQGDNTIKPYFRMERTEGGYMLKVAQEIARDTKVIDFALKKYLKDYRGDGGGFSHYFFKYKDAPKFFYAMEKREIIWFIEPYQAPPQRRYY